MTTAGLGLDTFGDLIDGLDENFFRSHEADHLPADLVQHPYRELGRIREFRGPVVERAEAEAAGLEFPNMWLLNDDEPIYLVLGFDAASEAFRRGTDFSSKGWESSLGFLLGDIIGFKDDPEHARYRQLLSQAFRRSHVERWTTELVEPIAGYLVGRIAERRGGDLVRDLAVPLPFLVTSHMMGLDPNNLAMFVKMTTDLMNMATDPAAAFAAKDDLGGYFAALIEDRRREPGEDLVSLLVLAEVDGAHLSDEEIINNLRWLLPAGIETTYRSMTNMWSLLIGHPDQLAEATIDPDPAIEESLRLEGPFSGLPRLASRDIELAGVTIPEGSGVYVFHGAANRDPARWNDPDRFDIRRPAQPHLTFAQGPHTCLGMHLARLQMRTSITEVGRRLPGIRSAAGGIGPMGFLLRAAPSCPVTI